MQLLTNSRAACFKTCRRQHFILYECGIRRETDAKALRMGTSFHNALEAMGMGIDLETAVGRIYEDYASCPEQFELLEWEYERETVVRMVCGYAWRWSEMHLDHIATEQSFEQPLRNPETNRPSTVFNRAGKIDGVIRLPDTRLAVMEHKLLGDDIGPDSPMWRRMRHDPQISGYIIASRELGHDVDTVLYDVARKPTIGPTKIPLLDELGAKIVIDSNTGERVKTAQGKWRQTGDKDQGYVLQERMMTPEEWGEKLNNDIAERPDFYFQRVEIPRMDDDLTEYQEEMWELQITMREAQKSGRWFRTVSKNTCGFCPVFDLCFSPAFDPTGPLPVGYVRVKNIHPELSLNRETNHVNGNVTAPSEEATTASV